MLANCTNGIVAICTIADVVFNHVGTSIGIGNDVDSITGIVAYVASTSAVYIVLVAFVAIVADISVIENGICIEKVYTLGVGMTGIVLVAMLISRSEVVRSFLDFGHSSGGCVLCGCTGGDGGHGKKMSPG